MEQPTSCKFEVKRNGELFYFTTGNDIAYKVEFRPSGHIFENDLDLQPFVYEISILILDNPTGKSPTADLMVASTVALIFGQFLGQHERVAVYIYDICDTPDQRGLARHRKFTSWFSRYKGNYVQFSDSIVDGQGTVYFTSLITRRENPYLCRVMVAFTNLVIGNTK